jgi:hypothetical protein
MRHYRLFDRVQRQRQFVSRLIARQALLRRTAMAERMLRALGDPAGRSATSQYTAWQFEELGPPLPLLAAPVDAELPVSFNQQDEQLAEMPPDVPRAATAPLPERSSLVVPAAVPPRSAAEQRTTPAERPAQPPAAQRPAGEQQATVVPQPAASVPPPAVSAKRVEAGRGDIQLPSQN